MTPISEHRLEAELRAMRPAPRPEFAARLDGEAAAGFRPDPETPRAWLAGVVERLRATRPRRILAPAGAVALTAIVVSTAVIANSDSENDARRQPPDTAREQFQKASPLEREAHAATPDAVEPSASSGSVGSAAQYDSSPPVAKDPISPRAAEPTTPGSGPYAARAAHRSVERTAQILLATTPSEVRDDAAQVFEAVHAADGIVLSSSVRDGRAGRAGARFELLIPSGRLSDAMASFSSIAAVRSRHESSQDITAPTVSAAERLQDANASVRGLLGQLAEADSDAARAATEAELRSARAKATVIRSRLAALERRDNLSRVSLRIETRDGASSSSGGGGPWGIGDGLHGAGRVLAVAAGVTVIAAAVLAPLALIALLAWLARGAWIRRARRHALE